VPLEARPTEAPPRGGAVAEEETPRRGWTSYVPNAVQPRITAAISRGASLTLERHPSGHMRTRRIRCERW